MPTTKNEKRICSHCGCENEFVKFYTNASSGPADLDTRSSGPERQQILYTIERCKNCNFCNENIEEPVEFDDSILTSKNYLKAMNSSYPEAAKNYMMASMIKESRNNYNDAAAYMLCACWILDDNNIDAKKPRIVAAKLFEKTFVTDFYIIIAIDLYRRAEEFERAKRLINKYRDYITDRHLLKLMKCEEVLIDIFDSECHNCSEIDKFIGESGLEEELRADTPEELMRKLFSEDSYEPIRLITGQGEIVTFEQVAVIPLEHNGRENIYTLLHPVDIGEDDEAVVFLLEGEEQLEDIRLVTDDEIINAVFEEYYKLREKRLK